MGKLLKFRTREEKTRSDIQHQFKKDHEKELAQCKYISSLVHALHEYELKSSVDNLDTLIGLIVMGIKCNYHLYSNMRKISENDAYEIETVYGSDENWYYAIYTQIEKAKISQNSDSFAHVYEIPMKYLDDIMDGSTHAYGFAFDPYDNDCLYISIDLLKDSLRAFEEHEKNESS